jgi:hypothetical protein
VQVGKGSIILSIRSVAEGWGTTVTVPLLDTVADVKQHLVRKQRALLQPSALPGSATLIAAQFLVSAQGTLLLDCEPLLYCGLTNLDKLLLTE